MQDTGKLIFKSRVFQKAKTEQVQLFCYLQRNIFLPISTNLIMSPLLLAFLKHLSAVGWFFQTNEIRDIHYCCLQVKRENVSHQTSELRFSALCILMVYSNRVHSNRLHWDVMRWENDTEKIFFLKSHTEMI